MKKQLRKVLCLGGVGLLSTLSVFGQATTVSENFDNNQVPAAFRAGQGYFLKATNGALQVKVAKQQWEEFSYDAKLDLAANPIISFRVRGDYFFEMNMAFVETRPKGNLTENIDNRFPDIQANFFPSKDFIDVSFDMTGLLKNVNATKITSVRFVINPACEGALNLEIDDFKLGAAAQKFPRMLVPIDQTTSVGEQNKVVLLRDLLPGTTITATSSNTALIPNPTVGALNNGIAQLRYNTVAEQSGKSTITLRLSQPGKSVLVTSFGITVNSNLAPTVNAVANQTVGAGQKLDVQLSGISDGNTERNQNVTFTATSSDQSVIKNSNIKVDYNNPFTYGKLSFTTEALATGSKDVNITLTAKDDGGTAAGGVDSKAIVVPVKVYAVYYKSPTVGSISNNLFAVVNESYTIDLKNLTDGNGGKNVGSIVAISSNTAAVDNPSVNFTPNNTSGSITYKLKNKQTSTISVVVTNSNAPANSNGNTSTTITFNVKGVDAPYTGYIEDFTTYGVDGTTPTPVLLGGDYYSSGTGGDDRKTWMTNLDGYDQKWFVEGQGREYTFTLNPASKSLTLGVNKPATVPNTFAGVWYSPRKLFNLSGAKYLSLTISANTTTNASFDIFDVNDNRYGKLENQVITTTPKNFVFTFDKTPDMPNFDFTKVAAVLFNSDGPFVAFNGTFTISNLKIGDLAEGVSPPKPASIILNTIGNRTIYEGTSGLDVLIDSLMVLKDGINQNSAIGVSVSSSNTSLIPTPAMPIVDKGRGLIKLRPASGTGTSTITLTATSQGVATKTFTFIVNVVSRNPGSAGTVTINQNQTFQTFQGIGAVPSSPHIDDMIEAGVSMVRFDIGAEYEPGLEGDTNDNSDPFVLDLTKTRISDRYDWKKIVAANIRVIGAVWTPPMWMKGKFAHRPQTYFPSNRLRNEMYDEFAEYILGACLAFKDQFGAELYSVCLQNEAEFYASGNLTATCGYTREEAAEVVKRTYPRLRAAGLSTRIHGFDQLPAQNNVLNWFQYFNSPAAGTRSMFDAYSIHAYGANAITPANLVQAELQSYYAEAQRHDPKKELWMTETSGGPGGEAGGVEEFSSQFSAFANNLSAWVPFDMKKSDGMRFYSSKSFSKFIRPGAVRVGTVNSGGAAGIAFKHEGDKTFTVVIVNSSNNPQQVKLAGAGLPSKMYAYLTSNVIKCQLIDSVSGPDYLVNLPAKSVITYYSRYEDVTANEEQNFAAMEMIVYPNPSKGFVSLMLPNESFKEITVTDLAGRETLRVKARFSATNTVDLELSDLPKGMYIISAKGSTTLRKKVVIE